MANTGYYILLIAWAIAIYSGVTAIIGAQRQRKDLKESSERSTFVLAFLILLASGIFVYALITKDFSIRYVAEHTSITLPLFYAFSAWWSGQAGSLLFWLFMLMLYTVPAVLLIRKRNQPFLPYIIATTSAIASFFLTLLLFIANPFETLAHPPADGMGLNPLLQYFAMVIHPPTLYAGYVGFAIPFGFAIGALVTGKLDNLWLKESRRWTLVPWFFLTIGNLLGAKWAYVELGWGGFWGWDPVENASFMPWLLSTAFIHSIMIQEKRSMLKMWNMILIILTFAMTIFGTFLTRSGILSSVHSFTTSGLGPLFMIFIACILVISFSLLYIRKSELRAKTELESLVSRESAFLFNNLILVGMAFAIFWGTIFPLISEAVQGVKITVGPPFFNQVNIPIGLILLFLTGAGPIIAWRRASKENFLKHFFRPLLIGFAGAVVLFALGIKHFYVLLSSFLCIFVLITIIEEFYRGLRVRNAKGENLITAFITLIAKSRRRYGGYIVHLGIVFAFIAFTGQAFQVEEQQSLKPGEIMTIKDYTLMYEEMKHYDTGHIEIVAAHLTIHKNGKWAGTLTPEKRFHRTPKGKDQPETEVALRSTLIEDLYVVLAGYDKDKQATFKVYVNPLVAWLWIGGLVMTIGTIICLWPEKQRMAPPKRTSQTHIQKKEVHHVS